MTTSTARAARPRRLVVRVPIWAMMGLVAAAAMVLWHVRPEPIRPVGPPPSWAAPGLKAILSADPKIRAEAAASMIVRVAPDELAPVLDALARAARDPDARVRAEATRNAVGLPLIRPASELKLAAAQANARQALIANMDDPDPLVRELAAGRLANASFPPDVPDELIVAKLERAAKDREPKVRAAALGSLCQFAFDRQGDPPPLAMKAMEADADPSVRDAAFVALGKPWARSEEVWTRMLRGMEAAMQEGGNNWFICKSILELGKPPASLDKPLLAALNSEDSAVRLYAAEILGRLGPELRYALPRLVEVAALEVKERRETAAMAILQIDRDSPEARSLLKILIDRMGTESDPVKRFTLVDLLAEFGPAAAPAVPALTLALREANRGTDELDPWTAERVAIALRAIGGSARLALPDLAVTVRRELQRDDAGPSARSPEALRAIAWIGPDSPEAQTLLVPVSGALHAARTENGRTGLSEILTRFARYSESAPPEVVAMGNEADPERRRIAEAILQRIELQGDADP